MSPERRAWVNMMDRCYRKTATAFSEYGGRGIAVCDRWRTSIENFLTDIGPRPSDAHSLDRKDVNGNYEPGNCRWATRSQQQRNRRVGMVTWNGKTQSVADWADELGVRRSTLASRISTYAWTLDEAMNPALRPGRKGGKMPTYDDFKCATPPEYELSERDDDVCVEDPADRAELDAATRADDDLDDIQF